MSFLSELGFSNEALGFEELVRIILKPGALFGALEQSVVLTFFMHLFSSCGEHCGFGVKGLDVINVKIVSPSLCCA